MITTAKRFLHLNRFSYLAVCGFVIFVLSGTSELLAQSSYSKLCSEGFSYEQAGNLDGAVAKYTDAIIVNPKSWEAYSYRAKANFRRQKTDEALTDITQAITLAPSNKSLYEVRAEIYVEKVNREKAIEDYNMVIAKTDKKDTRLYSLYFKRGQQYYWLDKHELAISDFNQAIQLASASKQDAAMIYSFRATSYYKLGRYNEAIKDFDLYFATGRSDVGSYFFQGLSFLKTNDLTRAKSNAQKMIETDPSKEIYFSGDRILDIYDLELRRKTTKQSVEEAHATMAEEKTITSKSLANIKLTDAFQKLNKAWLYSSGIEQQDRDVKDGILKDMFAVHARMKPKPELPEAARKYMVQANSATTDKKYPDALALWNKVQTIAPWYPTSYFNKALLFEYVGDLRSSIDNMNKYLELYPDAEDARGAKDKIYEWEGKVKNQPAQGMSASTIMKNELVPYKPEKPKFFIKGGLTMPTGATMQTPSLAIATASAEVWSNVFYEEGTIGLKQGYFVEMGLDLNLASKPGKVRFYYNPIVLGFSQNKIDWTTSTMGGIFTNPEIYTKPVSFIEVAQRYGIGFVPIPKLVAAIYYRPAFLMPLNFEILHEGTTNPAKFSVSGEMSSEKVFNLSNTFGFTLGYSFISFSYEMFMAKPGFDISVHYVGTPAEYTHRLVGRMPVKMNRIGLTFSF